MSELVNLTPHSITIFLSDDTTYTIPPSGTVARVEVQSVVVRHIGPMPVVKVVFGNVENLPDPKPGVVYVVSTVVLLALKEKNIKRQDVVAPDTSPQSVIRDKEGRIVGVRRFQIL